MSSSTKKSDDDSLLHRPNEIMKTPALRKSKYYFNTGSFWLHNNCDSTHPSMAASKENKLPRLFSGFKSQKFLHESGYDGVSGTDNDEQSLNNSASVFYLWPLEALSWFQNGSILLVNASCKRRALMVEDEFKNTHFWWLLLTELSLRGRMVTM